MSVLRVLAYFLLIAAVLPSAACQAQPSSNTAPLPDSTWFRYASPADAGFSADGVAEARAMSDSLGGKAAILIHDGAIVTEWGDTQTVAPMASIRKSIFSALVGIAVGNGVIDTSATLADYGIDDTPPLTDAEKRATVHDLLTSSSGVYHDASREGPMTRKPPRGSAEPGEQWYYNNWDFNAVAAIYEQETGTGMFDALDKKLAEPIGMEHYDPAWGAYAYQPQRSDLPSYSLWMSARDMARFGLLYLRGGQWGDQQVVPAEWVKASQEVHIDVPIEPVKGFGLSWWMPAGEMERYDTYLASGAGSQTIMVLPELDVVFVYRASAILERGVNGLEVRDILQVLLDARTGDAPAKPEFVRVETRS